MVVVVVFSSAAKDAHMFAYACTRVTRALGLVHIRVWWDAVSRPIRGAVNFSSPRVVLSYGHTADYQHVTTTDTPAVLDRGIRVFF